VFFGGFVVSTVLNRYAESEAVRERSPKLTGDQLRALHGILDDIRYRRHKGAVLQGYAGCGKTFLAAKIVDELKFLGYRVGLAAPTNKAAQVLRQSLSEMQEDEEEVYVQTVHSLLRMRLVRYLDGSVEFVQKSKEPISGYDVLVIDECSMISDKFLNLLQQSTAYLLFLGDPAQLPPVGYQKESPIFSRKDFATFVLREVVRQKGGSNILRLANAIRDAKRPFSDFRSYADDNSLRVIRHCDFSMDEVTPDARILSWTNRSVDRHNNSVHNLHFPWSAIPYSSGERIVLQESTQVGNTMFSTGTEGVILSVTGGMHPGWTDIPGWKMRVVLQYGTVYPGPEEKEKPYTIENAEVTLWIAQNQKQVEGLENHCFREARNALARKQSDEAEKWSTTGWALRDNFARIRHAYASTVHKSQGSTYRTAIVDLQDLQNPKAVGIFNRLLYTAVTRPSTRLILLH
jgi:exodeoxyribonuclease-5